MASSGTLLFGGIDTEKFSGELVTIDLVPSGDDFLPGGVVSYMIHLYGVTGTDTTGKFVPFTGPTNKMNVLLDSGTPITYPNDTLVQEIWDFVGAVADPWFPDYALIDCSLSTSTKTVDFFFDGILIAVPMSQLVNELSGTGISCAFGIAKRTNSDDAIIGESILRAIYVVYDMDNNQISLAQALSNSQTSNILQIVASP